MPDEKDRLIIDMIEHLKATAIWFRNADLVPLAEMHEKMLRHFEGRAKVDA